MIHFFFSMMLAFAEGDKPLFIPDNALLVHHLCDFPGQGDVIINYNFTPCHCVTSIESQTPTTMAT
jgi:hypothetical protein